MHVLRINKGQHAVIVGKTGSGKSICAREILLQSMDQYKRVIIVDPKAEFDAPEGLPILSSINNNRVPFQSFVFRPNDFDAAKALANQQYDAIFMDAYKTGDALVLIDETVMVCPSASRQQTPKGLSTLLHMGRSKGCSVISCTQRPIDVPISVFSQSSVFCLYRIDGPDEERMQDYVPRYWSQNLKQYQFYYRNDGTGNEGIFTIELNNA